MLITSSSLTVRPTGDTFPVLGVFLSFLFFFYNAWPFAGPLILLLTLEIHRNNGSPIIHIFKSLKMCTQLHMGGIHHVYKGMSDVDTVC